MRSRSLDRSGADSHNSHAFIFMVWTGSELERRAVPCVIQRERERGRGAEMWYRPTVCESVLGIQSVPKK